MFGLLAALNLEAEQVADTQYKEFHDKLISFRDKTETIRSYLTKKYDLPYESMPVWAYIHLYNITTLSTEHSSHYLCCDHDDPISDFSQLNERLMYLATSLFINCMSNLEYNAKNMMQKFPNIIELTDPRMKFRKIIHRSYDKDLVDMVRRNQWIAAIEVRNCQVHNNGIPDKTIKWKFSDELEISWVEGEINVCSIMVFLQMTEWIIDAFADWSDKFLEMTTNN